MNYCSYDLVYRSLIGAKNADEVTVSQAIAAASRLFDNLCQVEPDFFAKADSQTLVKRFRATDSNLLLLPPFVAGSIETINDVQASDWGFLELGKAPRQMIDFTPRFGEFYFNESDSYNFNFYNRQYNQRWNVPAWAGGTGNSSFVDIVARWGFAEIPADVVSAVVQLAIKIFRDMDAATVKMADLSEYQPQAVPPLAMETAKTYRQMELYRN